MNRRHFMQLLGCSPVVAGKLGDSIATIKNIVNEENYFLDTNKFPARLKLGYYSDGFRLEKGKITVIASRPSVGKSNLIQNIVQDISMSQNISIGFFSHVRKSLLLDRMIASQQILGASDIDSAIEIIAKFNVVINDTQKITMNELHALIEDMVKNKNIKLLAIDGLDNIYVKNSSADETVSIVFSYLNEISQYLNISIIVSVGLNRDLESRSNKYPRMTDINNYRVIEKFVGSIIYLYRDEIYKENSHFKGLAHIRFEHAYGGCNKTILMKFNGSQSCFIRYKPNPFDSWT